MKLKAVFDAVIVRQTEIESHGNIIVPDLGKEKNIFGEVVAVGPGKYTVTGAWLDTSIKVGDKVVLPQMGPVKVEIDYEEYFVCPENQILAIIED